MTLTLSPPKRVKISHTLTENKIWPEAIVVNTSIGTDIVLLRLPQRRLSFDSDGFDAPKLLEHKRYKRC